MPPSDPSSDVIVSRHTPLGSRQLAAIALILSVLSAGHACAQDSWTTMTPISPSSAFATAAAINGKIYVQGILDFASGPSALSIYSVASNSWSEGATPGLRRALASAVTIDGKFYVAGGCINSDCRVGLTNALEIYDPVTNSWADGAPMPTARLGAAAGAIGGKMIVSGGALTCPPCTPTASTEIYDPLSDSWSSGAPIPSTIETPASAVVDGLLYAIGGFDRSIGADVGTVQIYNPLTDTWSSGSPMPTARSVAAAGVIHGDILVVGGSNFQAVNESYNPLTDTWRERAPMPTPRYAPSAGVVDSLMYVIGGAVLQSGSIVYVGTNERYTAPCSTNADCGGQFGCSDNVCAEGGICQHTTVGDGVVCDDGYPCTNNDVCSGGVCSGVLAPAGTICRGMAGVCDSAETCSGTSADCPDDAFRDESTTCRESVGICDKTENCTGSGPDCPADAVQPASVECRASGGVCDIAENCTGSTMACPDDSFVSNTTVCRGVAGICDIAENCTGMTATCPADAVATSSMTCRAASGVCDLVETCTGTGVDCPSDSVVAFRTSCTTDADDCTDDICDGVGNCTHAPIPLAPVCDWAVVGGSDTRTSKVKTRYQSEIHGGVCADEADVGAASKLLDAASWALLDASGNAAIVRGQASVANGSVATGGGCLLAKGIAGTLIWGTVPGPICCTDSPIELPGGIADNIIDACGVDPLIGKCVQAKSQIPSDVGLLDSLLSTQSLGAVAVGSGQTFSILANSGLNVIDIDKLTLMQHATLKIDAQNHPDAVIVLRIAKGVGTKKGAIFQLLGQATPENVLFYAVDGNCRINWNNVGSGTLFCPAGRVQLQVGTQWAGAIAGGSGVEIGWNAKLTHVPFLGLAR